MPNKPKLADYRLSTEIERMTDPRKVLEEQILDIKVELSLQEVLRIAKKEFHDLVIDETRKHETYKHKRGDDG